MLKPVKYRTAGGAVVTWTPAQARTAPQEDGRPAKDVTEAKWECAGCGDETGGFTHRIYGSESRIPGGPERNAAEQHAKRCAALP
ncbi:hypothetical protein [Streptosporangium jomthongense]|uniref:HNH endonuclease n=1 Tax=Streptosporangium jomthongense TaxID=1193683 RepID=A0ABV8F1F5_9ACTN